MKKSISSIVLMLIYFISISQDIRTLYNQKIPLRDGIYLSSTIVLPENTKEPVPALLVLTPYIADRNITSSHFFAENGYAVVTADIRGRGNSEGITAPFSTQDGKDGYDVINWISKQDWCNGKVGMYGGSYLGMVQWQTLKEMPEALKTIIPVASVGPGIDFPKRNNIYYTYLAPYLTFISGKTSNQYSFTNIEIWKNLYRKLYLGEVAFENMLENLGINDQYFREWLQYPEYDEYWKNLIPTEREYRKFNIPILSITGYYDDDQIGALNYYYNHQKYSTEDDFANHYLIIGPWDHSGTRRPQTSIGDLVFSTHSVLDMENIHLSWFDWTLKGKNKPDFLKNKVMFYNMGDEKWYYENDLSSLTKFKMELYLNSVNGKANSIFHCGHLEKEPPLESYYDQYVYDPLDPKYLEDDLKNGHLINYSLYHNDEMYKNKGLFYISEPFEKDITIAGNIKLSVFLSMDVTDADFEILLYEIKENGEPVFLTTDYLRARYRESLTKENFPEPNKVYRYDFETPYLFVRKIEKESSVLLIIRNLNSPHYQKNFQSGKRTGTETRSDAKTSNVKLYHNASYRSTLELPIYIIHD